MKERTLGKSTLIVISALVLTKNYTGKIILKLLRDLFILIGMMLLMPLGTAF